MIIDGNSYPIELIREANQIIEYHEWLQLGLAHVQPNLLTSGNTTTNTFIMDMLILPVAKEWGKVLLTRCMVLLGEFSEVYSTDEL